MTDIEDALMALMAYQQADEEGVMVLVSRQAIHEVHDEYRRLSAANAQPVAWRWRGKGNKHWIYDPTPEWREDNKDDPAIDWEPLYGAPVGGAQP